MKGRLGSTIWTWVAINAVVLLAVVVVAYSAGEHSGGLPIASAMQAQDKVASVYRGGHMAAAS